ncbi:disease resistance protein L6-like [Rutidosis leptorrhynchoides]
MAESEAEMHRLIKKRKTNASGNAEGVDTGASGSMTVLTETDFIGSGSSPTETNNNASTGNCYEVFLSFRGLDTRHGFTDHLYHGLFTAGIDTFRDDDELRHGENIKPELLAAIRNSKISIPILSVNYGTSSWCLDELVQIMECKNSNKQIVLPIFYKVKPADVRYQTGRFGEAFHERESRLRERSSFDPTTLEKWKSALDEVGTLKGYEALGYEAELVKSIVRGVLSELKRKFELVISKNLVGIDNHVSRVMETMDNKSHATLFVGIHGMGGIGKTTLAKVIYNKLFNQFEHRSFIADVRESSKRNGIHYLQNKLVSDILNQKNEVHDQDEGTNFISSKFKGSKIIITSRNKKILKQIGVDYTYDHSEMDDVHSLILFSKHAFRRRDSPSKDFKDLTHEVVSLTGGLPLSLEVLGSLLCGEKPEFWRGTIDKLKIMPCKEVQETLKISYEALDNEQKQIFLDISCFFIGTDSRIASYMWDACCFFPKEGIEVLRFMSLIKIGDDHELQMHDHLRDLGRTIVRQENPREPQKHSRLWDPKEAFKVLKRNKGTDKIEAIDLSKSKIAKRDDNNYTAEQFKNLTRLRFLSMDGAHLSGDFEHSMEELKWLQWQGCPTSFEVNNFHLQELAVLELHGSEINEKWGGWSFFKMAEKLKYLDLSYCRSLENTDFLSAFEKLEVLILIWCKRLKRIDASTEDTEGLLHLELGSSRALHLAVGADAGTERPVPRFCLGELPAETGSLENLEILDISVSGIEELPSGIGSLRKLRELCARDCRNLKGIMVESMCNLSSLRSLDFYTLQEAPIAAGLSFQLNRFGRHLSKSQIAFAFPPSPSQATTS